MYKKKDTALPATASNKQEQDCWGWLAERIESGASGQWFDSVVCLAYS